MPREPGIQRFTGDKKHRRGWQSRVWHMGTMIRPWPLFADEDHGGKEGAYRAALAFKRRRIREKGPGIERAISKRPAVWLTLRRGKLFRIKTTRNKTGLVGVHDAFYCQGKHRYPVVEGKITVMGQDPLQRRWFVNKKLPRAAARRKAITWRLRKLRDLSRAA